MLIEGDIVRIKKGQGLIAGGHLFKVKATIIYPGTNKPKNYKLERVEEELNPIDGPFDIQIKDIEHAERCNWLESDLDLIKSKIRFSYQENSPTPDKPIEIKTENKNLFDSGIDINSPITINGSTITKAIEATEYVPYKMKEEKDMKILDIYKERKINKIEKEYFDKRKTILEQDTIQSIIIEMQSQVNAILEDEGFKDKLYIYNPEMITKKTREELEKIASDLDNKRNELNSTLEEIRALFELTEDYTERMKILKKYGIINKDGKVNI